jgi:hypothetical protein
MNKSDKKIKDKIAQATPAKAKVLPFDDGSKIKKKQHFPLNIFI